MLFYLTSRIISSIAAFLYPGYASYKTLSQRPASEEDLERWLMYWSVLGCIVGVEYVAEWLISWIPLYYVFKTLFLLYLALPQTRGSSYLYTYHLRPFFDAHEQQIDAALVELKTRVYSFAQERLRMLWSHVAATLGQQQQQQEPIGGTAAVGGGAAPPTRSDPLSGGFQLAQGLWNSYGPAIVASLRPAPPAATQPAQSIFASTPPQQPSRNVSSSSATTQSILERRRQLEAELAALANYQPTDIDPVLTPPASSSRAPSSSSDMHKRERTTSTSVFGGRFEEIQGQDVEGYDVGEISGLSSGNNDEDEEGSARPAPQKRGSSWFGWGGGGSADKVAYERVKSD